MQSAVKSRMSGTGSMPVKLVRQMVSAKWGAESRLKRPLTIPIPVIPKQKIADRPENRERMDPRKAKDQTIMEGRITPVMVMIRM